MWLNDKFHQLVMVTNFRRLISHDPVTRTFPFHLFPIGIDTWEDRWEKY